MGKLLYEEESYKIRGSCFEVWRCLAGAFKESVIDNALAKEFEDNGLVVERQRRIPVIYKTKKVGTYVPDFIINKKILIELKVKPFLHNDDKRQFWYYLKGSSYKLGFLINFGSKNLEIRRRIYEKARTEKFPCNFAQ